MPRGAKLARFTARDMSDERAMMNKLNELITSIELRLVQIEGPLVDPRSPAAGEEAYVVANVTEDRTFDADSTTLAELADVVGTLLTDLYNEEKLR